MGPIIKQTLCRLATLVEASATAAAIARVIAPLFETAFIPALKNFSIAARQRAVILLVNAVQTIKSLTAKHPVLIAALAACVAKLVRALTAAAAPTPVPLEHVALPAEHRLESPRLPPSPAPAPEDPHQHHDHTNVLSPRASSRSIWDSAPDRTMKAALTADELKPLRFAFDAAEYEHWQIKFASFLAGRYPHAAHLLSIPYNEAVQLIMDVPQAAETNKWLANQLRAAVDTSAPSADIFMHKLMETECSEPGISSSGIDVSERIRSAIVDRDTSTMEKEYQTFQDEEYLAVGMHADEIRLAIRDISKKIRVMPNHIKKAPHAVLRAIVSKIPPSPPALDKEQTKYLRALDLAERFGAEPTLESRVLDINTLTEWIVTDIANHTDQASDGEVDREASPAEHDPYEHDRPWLDDGPWLDDNS